MLSRKQLEQASRLLAQAQDKGVQIAGQGTSKAHGYRVFAVTSASEANRLHIVAVVGTHLVCDCKAGQNGMFCMHRALVRDTLIKEAAAKKAAAVAEALAVMAVARETSVRRGPAAFSLLK